MGRFNRLYAIVGVLAVLMLAVSAVTYTARVTSAGSSGDDEADCSAGANDDGGTDTTDPNHTDGEANDDCEAPGAAGVLDDGGSLLPRAGITIDQAIAAARATGDGKLGEVDLEYYKGKLVFNIDIGDNDVKVDASTGEVIGSAKN